MTTQNFGVRVEMRFKAKSPWGAKSQTLRNVTEIHYNYMPEVMSHLPHIAFESDIHQTGVNYNMEYIDEFETFLETSKAEEF